MKTLALTPSQLAMAASTEFPVQKHAIMEQHKEWFHALMEKLSLSSPDFKGKRGKISSGENLQLMPWMVADFPVIQQKDFDFVCRTLFWWGHYYSLNLIIKTDLFNSEKIFLETPVWLENTGDIWNNEVRNGYIKTQEIDVSKKGEYIRIAQLISIEKPEELERNLGKYGEWMKDLRS